MSHDIVSAPGLPETVPLQNAVLCIDCELVTSSRGTVCPVCGGHSLLGLATLMGGTLIDFKDNQMRQQRLLLFDLDVEMKMSQLEGGELSDVIEGLSRLIGPKLGRNRAVLHVNVEPVATGNVVTLKAA